MQLLLVEDEFTQTFQCALDGDECMPHRYTYVTKDGGIGEVALQTAHRQFLCEELQDGVRHTHIALGVLEIDGVHLVGHRTRPYLTGLDLLLEILHRDIHPDIAVEVDDNRVDTTHRIKQRTQPVIVGNLGGVLLALQAELLTDETVAKVLPVVLRICHMMGVVVACGPTKLSRQGDILQSIELLLQTIDEHHDLLTQTGGRCRLTVRLGEHRNLSPLLSIVVQHLNELLDTRDIHLLQSLLHREGHTGVVDILRGETEMDELLIGIKTTDLIELLLDVVLHGFHVVIGHLLNLLHALGVGRGKLSIDTAQTLEERSVETLQLRKGKLAQGDEILNLYTDAVTNERILRKILG